MRRLLQVLCLALTAAFVPAVATVAADSDVRAAFLSSNPNNGWEYGFVDEEGAFTPYTSTFDDGQGIAGWCLDNTPGPMGAITINYSDMPIDQYGARWEPGQVCILPPASGLSTVIRWTSPGVGEVRIDAEVIRLTPGADTQIGFSVDGEQLTEDIPSDSDGQPEATGVYATAKSIKSKRSVTARVRKGSKVDFQITSASQGAPGHVSAMVSIEPIARYGATSISKTSLGEYLPSEQARTVGEDPWSASDPFSALVERS